MLGESPMTPPTDENFRNDEEFVKMVERQSEQKVLLNVLDKKVDQGFSELKITLDKLGKDFNHSQRNCKNFSPKDSDNNSSFFSMINPNVIKVLAIVIIIVVGKLLGVEIPIK